MNKKKYKKVKNDIKLIYKFLISTIVALFVIMIIVFYQNINLKLKRNELNDYLEEYKLLKEEIDKLQHLKDDYEIIIKNNQELEQEKIKLQNKLSELDSKITNLNKKIAKLK